MMKKKKQSRSQSSNKINLEPSQDSSPSPRLLSIFRSKLASGKDLKHMFKGMRSKTVPGLSSQSRIVRCPKCQKLLQEPLDATSYKCGGCDSILHANRWALEGNDKTIPEALLSSENRSFKTKDESAEDGSKIPMRNTHREYNSRGLLSVERSHSETVYKHETSDICREWMRRADEFSVTGDSDAFASARSSPYYKSHSNASEWTQHEGRYKDQPRVPFYPASPSPSSAYEYGYNSPFHASQVSASEQSYYHHQPNQFKQYGREREGWFQEPSVASSAHFPGETSDGKYYHWPAQSQLHDIQYHNLYETNSSATPHRSVYSELSYQTAAVPHRSKSDTSSEKSSLSDRKRYVRERKPVAKRHILPSAGGAPFATCSYCLELLQLPQVSPHGKHKRYQVRCGSCSGIFKFSTREESYTVLDSPSFVDSGTGFADETNHQDSASEGHEEIYPDESHLSCSDNDSGDAICKSTDDVILSRNLETFEDRQNISSELLDLEALKPQLKPFVNQRSRDQQPGSTEPIGETSRTHLEQYQEARAEELTKIEKEISKRIEYHLEESGYEKNETLDLEEMVGDGESLEFPVYKNVRLSQSSEEAETVAERRVSHSAEPINMNEYVSETCVHNENARDTHEFDGEETHENEEYGGERTWGEIMGDKPGLHLEKSQYCGDSTSDSSSSNGETFEDTEVKEDMEHMSNTFSDAISATPESPLKPNESQSFIGHPHQSGEATVTISRIYEEQSKHEHENLNERQELDETISDRARYELKEAGYETNETLEPCKVGEGASIVSLGKASETFKTIVEYETGEDSSVLHPMDSQNKTAANSYGPPELVYLEGSGYAGARTWAQTMEDRAGLHLEEYESNYENYSKPLECTSKRAPILSMNEYELGTILEPDEDADGRSESSSRGSFNDHGSSEESAVLHESQDAKPEQSLYEYENSGERQELSNTVFDIARSELHECRYETNEALEPGKIVGEGFVVSLENASETIIGKTDEERTLSHQMEPQNENEANSYGTVEPVYLERSRYASERTSAETMGNEAGLQLEEYQSNPFEWTSQRAPTFRLHEYELETMPEPDEDADGRSISSSRDSFNDHESLKDRAVSHEEEPWLLDENKTEALKVCEMVEDGPQLHVEKCENESMKSEEIFEWTSERALTFRLHEYEPGTMLEQDEDADGRSEASSRGSFNDHGSSKERPMTHEEELRMVDHYETKAVKVGLMVEDGHPLHLEKGENATMELDEVLEPRDDRYKLCPDDTLEQERMMFHLEMSQDKQENPRQTFKQGDSEEDIPASASTVSSEDHESPSKTEEVDSGSEEEIVGDHLKHLQKENEKSGLTSEPYPHIYSATEPSEIVGLRHALYQTQSSPLRSPLTSPIHTPIGSPLHYMMSSHIRSPMHSHIVSPLRSPIHASGSLSDVLFFGKKS